MIKKIIFINLGKKQKDMKGNCRSFKGKIKKKCRRHEG